MQNKLTAKAFMVSALCIGLSACVAKDVAWTEQQQRLQTCEQYVDRKRDDCLRGDFVTIQDYKDEYKRYEKSLAREEKQKKEALPKIEIPKPVVVEVKEEQ